MKERLRRFMAGRYGSDEMSRALIVVMLVCFILPMFTKGWVDTVFSIAGWGVWFYALMRMFSRNHSKRWAENQKYLSAVNRIKGDVNRQKSYANQRKTHHIYKCPGCSQKIRVPKGKGKVEVTCPKCKTTFIKRS